MKHLREFNENENPTEVKKLVRTFLDELLEYGADGMIFLLDTIAKDYKDSAKELTNMDTIGISKHIQEASSLLKKRTGN